MFLIKLKNGLLVFMVSIYIQRSTKTEISTHLESANMPSVNDRNFCVFFIEICSRYKTKLMTFALSFVPQLLYPLQKLRFSMYVGYVP